MNAGQTSSSPAAVAQLAARRQAGWSLERAFYVDTEVYQAELERLFGRYWLYVGHISEIPCPGDYLTYNLGSESVIVIRGEDGAVHAHFNVCRHRGSALCSEPSGHVKQLVCPYHQWVYDVKGALLAAKQMRADFDKSQFSLYPVQVRALEGLLFISLSETPPDFAPIARDIGAQMRPHGLDRTKVAYRRRFELAANWKLAMENWRECYHCAVGHPEFCRITGHDRIYASPQGRQEYEAYAAARQAEWQAQGIECKPIPLEPPHTYYCCQRYTLKPGCLTESLDGNLVAPVLGQTPSADVGILGVNIFPIFSIQINADYAVIINMKPMGPLLTHYEVIWLVREDAIEGVDYQLEPLTAFWQVTSEQDVRLIEGNQRGILSQRYRPGPLSETEREDMEKFLCWYLAQLPFDETRRL